MSDLLGEIKKTGVDDRDEQTNNKQMSRFLSTKGTKKYEFVDVESGERGFFRAVNINFVSNDDGLSKRRNID